MMSGAKPERRTPAYPRKGFWGRLWFVWLMGIPLWVGLLISCTTTPRPYGTGQDWPAHTLSVAEALSLWELPEVAVDEPTPIYRGEQWKATAVEMIGEARESVIATVFLGSLCEETAPVYQMLIAKAQAGLEVYLVFDSISNLEYTASSEKMKSLHMLRQYGIHVLEFNPFSGERILMLDHLLYREHRKFLIVDGKTVALGGMNLNFVSVNDSSSADGQRDSMYVFHSTGLAGLLTRDFVEFWRANSWEPIDIPVKDELSGSLAEASPPPVEPNRNRAWVADQYGSYRNVENMYCALFDAAQKEVLILPFLPFLGSNMKESVRRAVQRGVTVRMLLPWDMRVENRLAVEYAALDLIDLGIQLYREPAPHEGQMYPLLHEKLVIVDDGFTMVGSANFNYRSMNLSYELGVVVQSLELNRRSREHFQELSRNAERISREMAISWRKFTVLPNYWFTFIGG